MQCDHSKDEDVDKLFERISKEQDGRLDVLVNNAYSAIDVRTQVNHLPSKYNTLYHLYNVALTSNTFD